MIEIEELLEALKKMKPRKTFEYEGIRPDMFKYMGEDGLAVLPKARKLKKIPEDWKLAVVILEYNYRGVYLPAGFRPRRGKVKF